MNQEELEEIKCLRAVLERILRVMDEGLFVDYQMEKFGRIKRKQDELLWEEQAKWYLKLFPQADRVLIVNQAGEVLKEIK